MTFLLLPKTTAERPPFLTEKQHTLISVRYQITGLDFTNCAYDSRSISPEWGIFFTLFVTSLFIFPSTASFYSFILIFFVLLPTFFLYCDMKAEIRNIVINTAIARQRRSKHVSAATDIYTIIEDEVFSMPSVPKLCNGDRREKLVNRVNKQKTLRLL
jgi:hypothetical protein